MLLTAQTEGDTAYNYQETYDEDNFYDESGSKQIFQNFKIRNSLKWFHWLILLKSELKLYKQAYNATWRVIANHEPCVTR